MTINDKVTTSQKGSGQVPMPLVLLLFFASGALALVYEVVWTRMMMQVFGSTALAVGTVLAAYMSGMAVGAWLLGKYADRSRHCLRLYAWLEIGIALAALVSHLLLSQIGPAHLALHALLGSSTATYSLTRFVLAFVLVMAPTILMGATLPVLTRFLLRRQALVGVNISTLYSINTLGAVSGVLLTGFYLIGTYGIHIPVYGAVVGNLLIGAIAWLASRRIAGLETASSSVAEPPADKGVVLSAGTFRLILIGLGISGFTSFAYEIYWTRSLVFILGNSTYALTTMLSAFLTGIALGGYLVRFLLGRVQDRAVIFGWIQVFLGVFSAMALPLLFYFADPQNLGQHIVSTADQPLPFIFTGFGVAFLVMLVPATLIGATFPLVGQIGVRDLHETGSSVGRVYAINTVGNVLGALLPGLFLISWLGIQRGILAMAALNVTLGFLVLFLRLVRSGRLLAWRFALPLVLVLSVLAMGRAPLEFQFPSRGEIGQHETLFYREGPLATTKVYWDPFTKEKLMSIDGIEIGGTGNSEFKQLLLAHFPKLLIKDVSQELTVGLGSGMLAGESLRHDGVLEITGVEIEPSVIEGARLFAQENHEALDNPRLKIAADDIGNFLRTTTGIYNVISADEKTADEYASNGFSYSLDYYQLLQRHLAPGGLVAQWVPTTLPPRQYRMILKTFSLGFPHVQLWYFPPAYKSGPVNTILVGSNEKITVDVDHINRQLTDNLEAFESLVPYGLTSAEAVLPHFVADERAIREAVEDSEINSLDHPRYEFYYPWEYAIEKEQKFIANHKFIRQLKRDAHADYLAGFAASMRLRQTFAAEFRYLSAFEKFLGGAPLGEQYQLFDDALATAPWSDSLRARVYALYRNFAFSSRSPAERARRLQRADELYGQESE